jgi:hypothetical protein
MSDITELPNSRQPPEAPREEEVAEHRKVLMLEAILHRLEPFKSDDSRVLKAIIADAVQLNNSHPVDVGSMLRLCIRAIAKTSLANSHQFRFSIGRRYQVASVNTPMKTKPYFLSRWFFLRALTEHVLGCNHNSSATDWGDIAGSEAEETTVTIRLKTRGISQDTMDSGSRPHFEWTLTADATGGLP